MKPLKECKVLVTPRSYGSQDPSLKTDLEEMVGEVVYNTTGKSLQSEQLQEMLKDVDGMIAGLDDIDARALQAAPDLKVVARYGVGINNVDLEAAAEQGITVTNTPGANAVSVAELTIGLILNMLRPILPAVQKTRQGEWPRFKGYSLEGKTVGILGLGAIGKETAKRLAGFNCRIFAYDIYPDEAFASKYELEYTELEDILARADIISLHLPLTPETEGLVDQDFITAMKPGAWLVNTARGELIQEDALVQAVKSGHLRGAALDAFRQEPPEKDNPLLSMEEILSTPHIGAHSDSAKNAMGRMAMNDCLAVLRGEEPKHRVNGGNQ
jgi:D-3-phosphoglycerate dehydrogenase